jgi:hypothetical protein
MFDDHICQMVNDAHQCYSENPNENCKNDQIVSMKEVNYINQYHKLIEDAKKPLYLNCTNFSKPSTIVKLYNIKVKTGWSDTSFN